MFVITLYLCTVDIIGISDSIGRRADHKQERPYNYDSTASRLLSKVKHDLTRLELRWGTTLESLVLFFYLFLLGLLSRSFCPHLR